MADKFGTDSSVLDEAGTPIREQFVDQQNNSWARRVVAAIAGAVGLAASENHIGNVGGHTFRSEVTLIRPSDTTAYTANDAVMNATSGAAALIFPNCARVSNGGITLMQAKLTVNKTGMTAKFRLHLFRDAPASIPNDNAAFSLAWANASARIGYVDFTTPISGSDCTDYYGVFVQTGAVPTTLVGTSVRGILQTIDAWTPASGDQFMMTLTGYAD